MLQYIRYELIKLRSRYFLILFTILLLVNALLCIYTVNADAGLPVDSMHEMMLLYQSDSEAITAEYEGLQSWNQEQNRLVLEQIALGNMGYKAEKLANQYAPDGFNDLTLFEALFARIDKISNFPDHIQPLIDTAENNIVTYGKMGIAENAYIIKYQHRLIDIYKTVGSQTNPQLEIVRGWNEYFSYSYVNILIFLMILVVTSVIVTQEKSTGILPILRVSKNGRFPIACAKMIASVLVACGIVFLFTGETFLIIRLLCGFSSPSQAVQMLDAYTHCPLVITIGEYFWLSLTVRLLTFLLFSAIIMLASVIFYHYGFTYLTGILVYGISLILYRYSWLDPDHPLKILNFVSTANGEPLFVRFRAINFLGNVIDYIPFMIVVYAALYLLGYGLFVRLYVSGYRQQQSRGSFHRISRMSALFRQKRESARYNSPHRYRPQHQSLILTELYKILIASGYIWFIILLLICKTSNSWFCYQDTASYADTVYREYMTSLAGEITEDKRQYVLDERKYINNTIDRLADVQYAYLNGEITFAEYEDYLAEYNYAYSRDELFQPIEQHTFYIDRLAAQGREAEFLYDTGWKELFFSPFDWTLYIAILLLFSDIFTIEYEGQGVAQILRLTRHGRGRIFKCKLFCAAAFTAFLCVIWSGIDFLLIHGAYELPRPDAPIWSIELLEGLSADMTILQYAVCFYAVKIGAAVGLACFLCALSAILRRNTAVMTTAVMLTLLPALLAYFGASIFSGVDFTGLLRATPMLLQNGMGLVYMVICSILCVSALIYAERIWRK